MSLESDAQTSSPIQIQINFPSHSLQVVLELDDTGAGYIYSGNFFNNKPQWFSLSVKKPGFSTVELTRIPLKESQGKLTARVDEITLKPES